MTSSGPTGRSTRHGTPAATTPAGMSRVTTLPAPMTDPLPIVTPPHTTAFAPIHTSSSSVMGFDVLTPCARCAASTERPAHTIEFRAFNGTLHAGEVKSYIQLCLAISAQALHTKAASPARPITDNPKYTFRCWLLRLGFIGDEFETARTHLLKRLPGNAAWRQAS